VSAAWDRNYKNIIKNFLIGKWEIWLFESFMLDVIFHIKLKNEQNIENLLKIEWHLTRNQIKLRIFKNISKLTYLT
jgi:hypothetical protein